MPILCFEIPYMGPIGIFDSGYGGLTIFQEILKKLPQYDYLYLGDNARVPYGTRSFETVFQYTYECVQQLFDMGCRFVILACNTASAKALRTIQQQELPKYKLLRKVLGVIRPTTELLGNYSLSKKVGILATPGTVASLSYVIEAKKFFPDIQVYQQACPMWVPLVENNELDSEGAGYFVRKDLEKLFTQCSDIDTIILACTHYPLLAKAIHAELPHPAKIVSQGPIVAASLASYLARHPEIEALCAKNGQRSFFTTETSENFNAKAAIFFGQKLTSTQIKLPFSNINTANFF